MKPIETYQDIPVITVAELVSLLQAMPQSLQVGVQDTRGAVGVTPPTVITDHDGYQWVCI